MRSSVCELKHSSIVRKFWLRIAYDCLCPFNLFVQQNSLHSLDTAWVVIRVLQLSMLCLVRRNSGNTSNTKTRRNKEVALCCGRNEANATLQFPFLSRSSWTITCIDLSLRSWLFAIRNSMAWEFKKDWSKHGSVSTWPCILWSPLPHHL